MPCPVEWVAKNIQINLNRSKVSNNSHSMSVKYSSGVNDRISFKKFLGLPLAKSSPDHSTLRVRNPTGHRHFQSVL